MDKVLSENRIHAISKALSFVELYHRHDVVGLENVPTDEGCLLAFNHSFATYDVALLQNKILRRLGRVSRALADRWFFKNSVLGDFMRSVGAIEGTQADAVRLLKEGELVCVAPGGMREAIRSSDERYQVLWKRRKGFAKVAYKAQVAVVLAACPKADDIFILYPKRLNLLAYKAFKLPLTILRGLGPTLIPRPVQLTHFLSKPIYPPKLAGDDEQDALNITEFHKTLVAEMQRLMVEAVAYRTDDE